MHVEPEHTLFPLFSGDSLTDVDHGRTLSYYTDRSPYGGSLVKIVVGLLLVVVLVVGVILALPFLTPALALHNEMATLTRNAKLSVAFPPDAARFS